MSQLSAHLDRGWDLVSRGDLGGALVSARKSLELDEDSPDAHNLLGYVLQAEGRAEDALEQYRAALELDESYVDAMLNAADVLIHPLGEFDEALQMVRGAIEWLDEDEIDERTDALLLEIDIHLFKGDEAAAASVARELPDGPFDNPALALQVGRARLDVGNIEGAEPLIRAATEQRPPIADAFYYLALVLEAKSDPRGALVAFLQTRELDLVAPVAPWSLQPDQFERRVQAALQSLEPELSRPLEGALVVVTDLPGAEVVAEGVDPRMPILLDALTGPGEPLRVGRVFVYRKNIERVAAGPLEIESEVVRALAGELAATMTELGGGSPS